MLNIVLLQPEIPQNTGTIARTCACTGATLHLVKPFKFEITDKNLKRAGLDYWDKVQVFYYDFFDELIEKNPTAEFFFIETGSKKRYTDVFYPNNAFIVFGQETMGIPKDILERFSDRIFTVPMRNNIRSLNLSNCVSLVLYEAFRQHDFNFIELDN
ncbi:MAG: tRNA (cytidine(34)-2'-O)-methyltransferase [Firmicutes bacterium]|nr:tRNA (cytidine(34)-2'-O)-methyltransferase [Bacillota bacterium]